MPFFLNGSCINVFFSSLPFKQSKNQLVKIHRKTGIMYRSISLVSLAILTSSLVHAQDVTEAYNLSNMSVQGTARSMGFGNALGSVGGDFSTVSVNPAGLGIYRSSELMATPSLKINGTSSSYTGVTTNDNTTAFNFNNIGIVLTDVAHRRRRARSNWQSVSFAFGFNRLADFNNNYTYTGQNNTSSASLAFESDANLNKSNAISTPPGSGLGYMGFQSYLLDTNTSGQFYSIVPFTNGVSQLKSSHITGGINEMSFSLGGSYRDKLLLGISIGVPFINFQNSYYYQESLQNPGAANNTGNFQSFTYSQDLSITGYGLNAKLGAIYKITDFIRVGAAFHTPTYYSINDVSNPSIVTNKTTSDSSFALTVDNGGTLQNQFSYNFVTPWKGVISGTFLLKNIGFLTADIEYVDYSTMRYIFPSGIDYNLNVPFQEEADQVNQQIKKIYKSTVNFRLGAEYRVTPIFMVRAGAGYYGNPYTAYGQTTNNPWYTNQHVDLSVGAGLHQGRFFADVALVHGMYTVYQQPYSVDYSGVISSSPATIPTAKTTYSTNNVALTLGMKLRNAPRERRRPMRNYN